MAAAGSDEDRWTAGGTYKVCGFDIESELLLLEILARQVRQRNPTSHEGKRWWWKNKAFLAGWAGPSWLAT